MSDYTNNQVVAMVKRGRPLERVDLAHLDLQQADLENGNFRRADLGGANLEGACLRKAVLASTNLREAYLARADLSGANLQKADLEGANLEGANLQDADLSRANLESANLEGANLNGARLASAQLELANLGRASLVGAALPKADLRESYLGGAKLLNAQLHTAQMEKANLEEADFTEADLREANLRGSYAARTDFSRALLENAAFHGATLNGADFSEADLRAAALRYAKLDGATFTAARLGGVLAEPEQFERVEAEWVDLAADGDAQRVEGAALVDALRRLQSATPLAATPRTVGSAAPAGRRQRFFGEGDVLRNATLEFGDGSEVEIQSRFEKCSIKLVEGSRLTIGPEGVLDRCRVQGPGDLVIHGKFAQEDGEPSIVGPRSLFVGAAGVVDGAVQQHPDRTRFGFECGCEMRLKILKYR
jgi:uncharacterized protein YjbI with pentapeptide repeats